VKILFRWLPITSHPFDALNANVGLASPFAKASEDKSEAALHGISTNHLSPITSHVLFASVMFELIDNDGADDDAAFDDLLPVSGNVGQVEDVI
jgi:hypothetical protein